MYVKIQHSLWILINNGLWRTQTIEHLAAKHPIDNDHD